MLGRNFFFRYPGISTVLHWRDTEMKNLLPTLPYNIFSGTKASMPSNYKHYIQLQTMQTEVINTWAGAVVDSHYGILSSFFSFFFCLQTFMNCGIVG